MCTAGASTTLQIQPATPLRLTDPRHRRGIHVHLKFDIDWKWGTNIGKTTDLRPIQVRLRGTSKARLPGASAPFKSVTIGIRLSDQPYDGGERPLRSPHWLIGTMADDSAIALSGQVRSLGIRNKPLGYEVQILQAGRLLGRIAAAGKCDSLQCQFRKPKVSR